jgi:hypothetical protein
MIRIAGYFYNPAVFNMQQQAAPGMAQTAIASANFHTLHLPENS